jgi:hypothetical protein
MQLIAYTNDSGKVALLIAAPECGLSLDEIAAKDIPLLNDQLRPYLILDDSALPDRQYRDRWVIVDGSVVLGEAPPEPPPQPEPTGFYEEMIGATGGTNLTSVFVAIRDASIANGDTSSLVFASMQFTIALQNNNWAESYAPHAFDAAYTILKSFLTAPQITIVNEAIARYHLGIPI